MAQMSSDIQEHHTNNQSSTWTLDHVTVIKNTQIQPFIAECKITIYNSTVITIGSEVCRYNWHSAGYLGWLFPMLIYIYIYIYIYIFK